jgi:hypothetical protein
MTGKELFWKQQISSVKLSVALVHFMPTAAAAAAAALRIQLVSLLVAMLYLVVPKV